MATVDSTSASALESLAVAAKAIMGITARSLAPTLDVVTLPQFRLLVLLSGGRGRRPTDLARHLGVHPSGVTRMANRLQSAGLLDRSLSELSNREMTLTLSPEGEALVAAALARRERELARLLDGMSVAELATVATGMQVLAARAPDADEQVSLLGW